VDSAQAPVLSDIPDLIQTSDIYVDAEGEWFNEGTRIFRREIIELFLKNLHLNPDGTWFIELQRNRCSLEAADTPFVIARADRVKSEGSKEEILLRFKHLSSEEPLDPSTLCVGRDNVLYCRIHGGRLPARFSRPAYYQFAEWIGEDSETGEFFVEVGGKRYSIPLHPAS
jgi:hypothetical protein